VRRRVSKADLSLEEKLALTVKQARDLVRSNVILDFLLKVVVMKVWGAERESVDKALELLTDGGFIAPIGPETWETQATRVKSWRFLKSPEAVLASLGVGEAKAREP